MSRDLKSRAKKGRFFPIKFSEAVHEVRMYTLNDPLGDRIKVRMKNTKVVSDFGYPLINIIPRREVIIHSLPEEIHKDIARSSILKAFGLLARQRGRRTFNRTKYSSFCAYLDESGKVIVTRKDVSRQIRGYTGTEKFSNSFKNASVRVKEVELKVDSE